jgi:glycosyltransferase involved in cell wall biosynthesis
MRIFYHCYDHNHPTGGQKHTYQHVDVLNRNGFEAYAVHAQPGFRLTWFENSTAVLHRQEFDKIVDTERDFMVLPEDLASKMLDYPCRKVVFNKNLYHGARAVLKAAIDPYHAPDVIAVFAVSEHNARHLRLAYPAKPVLVVRNEIRLHAFPFRPLTEKRAQIACLPKAMPQLATLTQILRARAHAGRNRLGDFDWVVLKNMTEEQMGETLRESLALVFLNVEEGLPRVPLEAMAAGCLVAAYATGPLRECLPEGCGFPYGDIESIVDFIERIGELYPSRIHELQPLADRGRSAAEVFTAERQTRTVLEAWSRILELACAPSAVNAERLAGETVRLTATREPG